MRINPIALRLNTRTAANKDFWSVPFKDSYPEFLHNVLLTRNFITYWLVERMFEKKGIAYSHLKLSLNAQKFKWHIYIYDGRVEEANENINVFFKRFWRRSRFSDLYRFHRIRLFHHMFTNRTFHFFDRPYHLIIRRFYLFFWWMGRRVNFRRRLVWNDKVVRRSLVRRNMVSLFRRNFFGTIWKNSFFFLIFLIGQLYMQYIKFYLYAINAWVDYIWGFLGENWNYLSFLNVIPKNFVLKNIGVVVDCLGN